MSLEALPADLLLGCVEIGGALTIEADRLVFQPGEGESSEVAMAEIAEIRLGGPNGMDANRMDLILLDRRTVTLLIVGRDRVASVILGERGWETDV